MEEKTQLELIESFTPYVIGDRNLYDKADILKMFEYLVGKSNEVIIDIETVKYLVASNEDMYKDRIIKLIGFIDAKWYKGKMIQWMIVDGDDKNTSCDLCGNIANGVISMDAGLHLNIPMCKSHIIQLAGAGKINMAGATSEYINFPCQLEYINKVSISDLLKKTY